MSDLKEYLEEELGWSVELTAARNILERLGQERFDLITVDVMIHPLSLDADRQQIQNVHFEGVSWLKTGLEFLKRLRTGKLSHDAEQGTSPNVPVIVISSLPNQSIMSELGEGIHVDGCIEKPFRLSEMVDRMCKLLQE